MAERFKIRKDLLPWWENAFLRNAVYASYECFAIRANNMAHMI
jgi:hypothetical protein